MLVGITGNLGSGKSELLRVFGRFGHRTYDADKIVDELYKDAQVLGQIEAAFGQEVVKGNSIDRKVLAAKVFNSSLNLKRLNGIIHPLVRERISKIPHYDGIVFVEVPLLYEAKMQGLFSKVILVKATHETCRRRALKRGFAEEDFERRVASQFASDRVESAADFVLDSERTPGELGSKAEKIIEALRAWK